MTYQFLQLRRTAEFLHITINRPEARNALSLAVLDELKRCFDDVRDDPNLLAASIRGAGERCFAAGGDLHEISAYKRPEDALAIGTAASTALDAIRWFPLPVYALLNGHAIGGGGELAMACDVRLAARDAKFGYAQASLNLAPAWGGGSDLIRVAGSAAALELMASAALIDAEEARRLGIVQLLCPSEQRFDDFCAAYFERLSARRPQVMRAIKGLTLAHRGQRSSDNVRAYELEQMQQTWIHDDHWQAHDAVLSRISQRS